jgi:GAF domain-containing protein
VDTPRIASLAQALLENTRRVVAEKDRDDALANVVHTAIEAGICQHAGISERVGAGEFRTSAASDDLVVKADSAQYELNEGPCVDASYEDDVLFSGDVEIDPRWPRWGLQASGLGIRGVASVSLYIGRQSMGALNIYSSTPRIFNAADLDVARMIGAHASVALAHFRGEENLWKAIDARHRIGLAQGIVVAQYHLSVGKAFAYLLRRSQAENVKLSALADDIIASNVPRQAE